MKNYLMIKGKKIEISEETANNIAEQFKEDITIKEEDCTFYNTPNYEELRIKGSVVVNMWKSPLLDGEITYIHKDQVDGYKVEVVECDKVFRVKLVRK